MSNPIADNADYFNDRPPKEEINVPIEFDPKAQWHKVFRKLHKYHHDDDDNNDDDTDNDSSSISSRTNNNYEMQRLNNSKVEDDALPSAEDMNQESKTDHSLQITTHNDKNYFQNPFSPTTNNTDNIPSESNPEVKRNWGKTLDKVRLIANMHTLPQKKSSDLERSSLFNQLPSLSPFYPPLFDPPFIALSKDEHGNPWVSLEKNVNCRLLFLLATCFTSFFKSEFIYFVHQSYFLLIIFTGSYY